MKLLPLFLFFSLFSFSQEPSINNQKKDSITYYYKNAKDSLRINYLKKSLDLSKEIRNDSILRKVSIEYGLACYFKEDTLGLKEANKHLRFLYLKNKDSLSLAKVYHYKALIKKIQFQLDSSYKYYHESKNISILLKDSTEVGRRLLSMGLMQKNEKYLTGAESSLVECLQYLEPLNNYGFIGSTYNNLGLVLVELDRNDEARNYFRKSYENYAKSIDSITKKRGFLDYYNNMGFSLMKQELLNQAIPYLKKGLQFERVKEDFRIRYESLFGNLADCYYELGKKELAWKMTFQLKAFREKFNNIYGLSLSHNGIAYYYSLEGEKNKALFHSKKSYDFAKKSKNNSTKLSVLLKLANLTSGEQSKKYFKEYVALRDMLYEREANLKNQFALIRYETEKKEKENVGLKLKDSQSQAMIESERLQKIIFALIGVLALVISIAYYRNRRKKMMYETQLQKATVREEERQQIAKSLHDEVAGDLRMLHQKLANTDLEKEAKSVEIIKENVRNLSHQLSSVSFDEVSFKDQMVNLIADYFTPSFRISVKGIDTVPWEEINSTIKRTFYLCVRESLQNTLKYAEATKFFISFSVEKKEILLHLEDDGKGFEASNPKKGIGLKNLKERVEEIHGVFQIESTEEGTKTKISIPANGK